MKNFDFYYLKYLCTLHWQVFVKNNNFGKEKQTTSEDVHFNYVITHKMSALLFIFGVK